MKNFKFESFLAMLIAFLAVTISIWQGLEQRKHNRLSVKPVLNFELISNNNTKSIMVSNNGLGPAIVKNFTITIDGKRVSSSNTNPWAAVTKGRGLEGKISQMWYFSESSIVKSDDSYNLFRWDSEITNTLDIEISIDYQSMYEEDFSVLGNF